MTELAQFHRQLLADIQGGADANGIIPVEVFLEKSIELLTEAGEIDSGSRAYYGDKFSQKELRIDGYGGDPRESAGILSLLICDFEVSDEVRRVTAKEIVSTFRRLTNFLTSSLKAKFREGLEESSPGYALADLISTTWKSVEKVKLILISNADNRAIIDAFGAGMIDGHPVTYNVWDLKRLQKYTEQGQAREDPIINFAEDFGGAIPLLRASGGDAALESYLAVISGNQLAGIYDKWGARLLESNVRSFLQARGKVNRGIRNTIAEEPHMFLAYNNGISATADALEVAETDHGLVALSIDNLQIVNGGQTTASVHAAKKSAPEQLKDVYVQMKLSIVPRNLSETVVPKISEYANSQNKVNAADFFANHPFHVRMEEFSRRFLAPAGAMGHRETKWFYERARGQYADQRSGLTPAVKKAWDAEYPRSQFFTKTDLAKYANTFQCKPHIVSLGAQKNFSDFAISIGKRWGQKGYEFDETWYRRLIAQAIVFRQMEKTVSSSVWYEGGYRANIVTYAIAKISHDVRKAGRSINLDQIWKLQNVPNGLKGAMEIAGTEAQSVILNPQVVRNIGEWAKKEACWNILSKAGLDYGDALSSILIDPEEAKTVVREKRENRSLDEGIVRQSRVIELGPAFWQEAQSWGRNKRALSEFDVGILETCTQIPNRIPSDRQCDLAIKSLNKLIALGFIHPALEANS